MVQLLFFNQFIDRISNFIMKIYYLAPPHELKCYKELSLPIAFIFFKNGDTCHQVPIEYRHKNFKKKKNLAGFYIV